MRKLKLEAVWLDDSRVSWLAGGVWVGSWLGERDSRITSLTCGGGFIDEPAVGWREADCWIKAAAMASMLQCYNDLVFHVTKFISIYTRSLGNICMQHFAA